MRAATVAFVAVGLALALALGVDQGFDTTSITILVLIALVGALAIAAAGKFEGQRVTPGRCAECNGVISRNAPYCKHCGSRQDTFRP